MKVTHGLPQPPLPPHPVVAIGNFDGQHLGHLALLTAVREEAARKRGTPMVLTFDPHPIRVLKPDLVLQFLTTLDQKLSWFEQVGIQEVVILEFTHVLARFTPERFMREILRDGIGVKEIFVGEHFVFGKGRSGSVADLKHYESTGHFHVHTLSPVREEGAVVSSTRIRTLIQEGKLIEASQCLGRAYSLHGRVVKGEHRGRGLGYPTANFPPPQGRVIPPDGVYVTLVEWNHQLFDSVSYIGTSPTFGEGERLIEVHLLDRDLSLYGQGIAVYFLELLRGDLVFDNPEELAARIDQDVRLARESLKVTPFRPKVSPGGPVSPLKVVSS